MKKKKLYHSKVNPWTLRLTFAQFKNMTLPLRFFHPASTPCFFRLLTIIYGETGFLWLADLPAVWILPIAFSVCSSVFILSANWLLDPEAGSDSSLIPFIRCYLVFAQTARGTLFLILSLCHVNSLRFLMLSPPNSSRGVEGDILTLSSLLTIICQPAFQEFKGKVIFFTHMLTISELAFPMLSFFFFFLFTGGIFIFCSKIGALVNSVFVPMEVSFFDPHIQEHFAAYGILGWLWTMAFPGLPASVFLGDISCYFPLSVPQGVSL